MLKRENTFYQRLYLLFLSLFCLMPLDFAQVPNWTTVKETNINVANAMYPTVDIFTNRYGNHIIVHEDNGLKYYRMNVNGQAGSPVLIESSSVISPSISGDADNLYIVYGMSNTIKVKRSTNGGTNWSSWTSFSISTTATSLESVVSNGRLHITYLDANVVKYRYRGSDFTWVTPMTVSTGETGINPRIAAYYYNRVDRIYFLYQKNDDAKWRYYDFNEPNHWGSLNVGYTEQNVSYSGFRVDNSNMIIYFIWHESNPYFLYYFAWAILDLNNNFLYHGNADLSAVNWKMYSTQTEDGISHTAHYYEQLSNGKYSPIGIWRAYDAANFPSIENEVYEYISSQDDVYHINISSAGNEVHIIWQDDYGNNNGNNLRYKYDDQNPVAPQNITISNSGSPSYHPVISWSLNNEPDVYANTSDGYLVQRRLYNNGNGTWTSWSQIATTSGQISDFIDTEITNAAGAGPGEAEYRIRAKDVNDRISGYSSTVSIGYGISPEKGIVQQITTEIFEYSLNQNFPNPFNPNTSIYYSLKNPGLVKLRVFNMLGEEVAELVNENQSEGYHSVEFNANDLPSGIYIYQIRSGDFSDIKKMMLAK